MSQPSSLYRRVANILARKEFSIITLSIAVKNLLEH